MNIGTVFFISVMASMTTEPDACSFFGNKKRKKTARIEPVPEPERTREKDIAAANAIQEEEGAADKVSPAAIVNHNEQPRLPTIQEEEVEEEEQPTPAQEEQEEQEPPPPPPPQMDDQHHKQAQHEPQSNNYCGKPPSSKRMADGYDPKNSQPWTLRIKRRDNKIEDDYDICAGVLIDKEELILATYASCIPHDKRNRGQVQTITPGDDRYDTRVVELGRFGTAQPESTLGIDKLIVRKGFKLETGDPNGIALLKLRRPPSKRALSATTAICRPKAGVKMPNGKKGECIVAGWGETEIEEDSFVPSMRAMKMKLLTKDQCAKRLWENLLCAGRYQRAHGGIIRKRDMGAAFACADDAGVWTLFGLAADSDEMGKGGFVKFDEFENNGWVDDAIGMLLKE